jgi:hypothetical protein
MSGKTKVVVKRERVEGREWIDSMAELCLHSTQPQTSKRSHSYTP